MSLKLVVNNTTRVIYGHYRDGSMVKTEKLLPGINRVPVDILALLLSQSGFKRLVDSGDISKSPGDISAGYDVYEAVQKGEDSRFAPPPIAPPNVRRSNLPLLKNQHEAIQRIRQQNEQLDNE